MANYSNQFNTFKNFFPIHFQDLEEAQTKMEILSAKESLIRQVEETGYQKIVKKAIIRRIKRI